MSRYTLQDKVIWITGASSGIGKALTLALSKENTVIASSRNSEKLLRVCALSHNIRYAPADVTKAEQLASIADTIKKEIGHIDLLIANAGDCQYLEMNNFSAATAENQIKTNYLGFVNTLEAALPLLRQSNSPYIAAMSSSSIYAGLPRAAAYSASKAAISQFMECLAADLKHEGFTLSLIHPGFVDTTLTKANDFPMPFIISAEQSAEEIISGIERRKFNIEFPKRFTILLKTLKLAPPFIRHKLTGRLSRNTINEH